MCTIDGTGGSVLEAAMKESALLEDVTSSVICLDTPPPTPRLLYNIGSPMLSETANQLLEYQLNELGDGALSEDLLDGCDLELNSSRDSSPLLCPSLDLMWSGTSCSPAPLPVCTGSVSATATRVIAVTSQSAANQRSPCHSMDTSRAEDGRGDVGPQTTVSGRTRIISVPASTTRYIVARSNNDNQPQQRYKRKLKHFNKAGFRAVAGLLGPSGLIPVAKHRVLGCRRQLVECSSLSSTHQWHTPTDGGVTSVTRPSDGGAISVTRPSDGGAISVTRPGDDEVKSETRFRDGVEQILRTTDSTLVRLLLTGQDIANGYRILHDGQCITPGRAGGQSSEPFQELLGQMADRTDELVQSCLCHEEVPCLSDLLSSGSVQTQDDVW